MMDKKIKGLPLFLMLIIMLVGCGRAGDKIVNTPEDISGLPQNEHNGGQQVDEIGELCVTEYEIFSGFEDLCLTIGVGITDYRITIYDNQKESAKISFVDRTYYALSSFYNRSDVSKAGKIISTVNNCLPKIELLINFDGLENKRIIKENVSITRLDSQSFCAKMSFVIAEGLSINLNLFLSKKVVI